LLTEPTVRCSAFSYQQRYGTILICLQLFSYTRADAHAFGITVLPYMDMYSQTTVQLQVARRPGLSLIIQARLPTFSTSSSRPISHSSRRACVLSPFALRLIERQPSDELIFDSVLFCLPAAVLLHSSACIAPSAVERRDVVMFSRACLMLELNALTTHNPPTL